MARYLVSGGTGNWNSTTNWSATSGGAAGASFPVSTDDVIIDGNSGGANITVNVASAALTLTISNSWTNTLTITNTLTVSGSITLGSAMTSAGTGVLSINATGTLTSNGKTLNGAFTFAGTSQTYTFADDWTINGLVTNSATTSITVNGATQNINCAGGFANGSTTNGFQGTITIVLKGGTWTSGTTAVRVTMKFDGNCTVSGVVRFSGSSNTMTYISGTITTTGSTLTIHGSCTLDTNGINWNNCVPAAVSTVTLLSDITFNGTWIHTTTGGAQVWNGAFNMYVGGNMTLSSGRTLAGTSTVVLNCLVSQTLTATGSIATNLTFNAAGTITVGNVTFLTGTITYTAGTMSMGTSTLTITNSATLATSGMTWANISFATTSGQTCTLNETLNVSDTLSVPINMTFGGTSGFITWNFLAATANRTMTLTHNVTYHINGSMTIAGTAATPFVITSTSGAIQAILILAHGATQDIDFCNATRINSSAAQTIWSFQGVLTTTTNWGLLTAQAKVCTVN